MTMRKTKKMGKCQRGRNENEVYLGMRRPRRQTSDAKLSQILIEER